MSNDESHDLAVKLAQVEIQEVESKVQTQSFFNRGMKAVTIAQFFSALADNALLFVLLALAMSLNYPTWSEPIFQILFVAIYIVTAPFVGVFADAFDKGRVMMLSNGLKLFGAIIVCFGINPFVGYALVALGAALYSPAKYGILGELNSDKFLVKANGLIEASTIAAILIGAILGGMLADHHIQLALIACALFYFIALIANIFIPTLAPMITVNSWNPKDLFLSFIQAVFALWKDREARISLLGTSLFWGAGITLRFLLIAWVPYVLGITNKTTPAILNAVVAIGIVLGAALAAKMVPLKHALKAIPAGILMGIVVVLTMWVKLDLSQLHSIQTTLGGPNFSVIHKTLLPVHGLLLMIGALGGFFIVPLNALLQARGKELVGVGKAIAIQNFSENSAMFAMLGIYFLFQILGVSVIPLGIGFGALFALSVALIWVFSSFSKSRKRA